MYAPCFFVGWDERVDYSPCRLPIGVLCTRWASQDTHNLSKCHKVGFCAVSYLNPETMLAADAIGELRHASQALQLLLLRSANSGTQARNLQLLLLLLGGT